MQRRRFLVSTVGILGTSRLASPVTAQGGRAEYVVSVSTENTVIPGLEDLARLGGGNLPPELAGMFGAQRKLTLNLRSPGAAPANATAKHLAPEALKVGRELPLELIRPMPGSGGGGGGDRLPDLTIKVYWGCGDEVKPTQPKVSDLKTIEASMRDALRQGQQAMAMRPGKGKAPTRMIADGEATTAYWPNAGGRPTVIAKDASLVGNHGLQSSYAGNAEFALDRNLDFMEAVTFTSPSGRPEANFAQPTRLAWNRVIGATGYGLTAMSSPDNGKTLLIWWSSSAYSDAGVPTDFTPPDRVASLIRSGVVLSTDTLTCTIPRNVFRGCPGVMVQLVAYGPVRTFAQPQQTPVKVQVKSTGMLMLGGPG